MRTRWPVLVALWLAVGGCGGAQTRGAAREATPTATQAGGEAEEQPTDRRAQIERLEREIQARVSVVPADSELPPQPTPGVSRPPTADGEQMCEQACQATGSICQAAQRICSLADEMDDDWARGRCRVASRTCQDTRRRATNHCGTC